MAPPLISLVSQYDCLKTLASYLWSDDLRNLADTCSEINECIRGNDKRFAQLAAVTFHCDGSSGRVWKADWMNASHVSRNELLLNLSEEQRKEVMARRKEVLETLPCSSSRASQLCDRCGDAVCNTCRFQITYLHLLPESAHKDVFEEPTGFHSETEKDLLRNRWVAYCTVCEQDIIKAMPKESDGSLKVCRCIEIASLRDGVRWMCVPCAKEEPEKMFCVSRCTAKCICANRSKVQGCRGISSAQFKLCGWCGCDASQPFRHYYGWHFT